MPQVKPEIMVWARETAGLSQQEAAGKLGFKDSRNSDAVDKLAALEFGVRTDTAADC
jgi:ribosome-binding protein aMBF1 (putative translation factor)